MGKRRQFFHRHVLRRGREARMQALPPHALRPRRRRRPLLRRRLRVPRGGVLRRRRLRLRPRPRVPRRRRPLPQRRRLRLLGGLRAQVDELRGRRVRDQEDLRDFYLLFPFSTWPKNKTTKFPSKTAWFSLVGVSSMIFVFKKPSLSLSRSLSQACCFFFSPSLALGR